MSKHTTGPWLDHWDGEGGAFVSAGGTAIANMVGPAECRKANARLIAAVPELLECLRELYAIVRGECPSLLNEDSGGNAELELAIIDAIAKAEGTTHA